MNWLVCISNLNGFKNRLTTLVERLFGDASLIIQIQLNHYRFMVDQPQLDLLNYQSSVHKKRGLNSTCNTILFTKVYLLITVNFINFYITFMSKFSIKIAEKADEIILILTNKLLVQWITCNIIIWQKIKDSNSINDTCCEVKNYQYSNL